MAHEQASKGFRPFGTHLHCYTRACVYEDLHLGSMFTSSFCCHNSIIVEELTLDLGPIHNPQGIGISIMLGLKSIMLRIEFQLDCDQ